VARLPAASSSLLLNLEAVYTMAIAAVLGREHLGRMGLLAALFSIAGAVLLSDGSLSGACAIRSKSPPSRLRGLRCRCWQWLCCWGITSHPCK
jgi:drug/metabolite transporter (DMT)-like permease